MAIPAALNSIWEVRVKGSIEGQETDNVFHFSCVGATADVELHLILVLATCFIDHIIPVMSSAWSMTSILWKQVSPTLGPEFETIPTGTLTGGGSANSLPSYVSAVVSKRTAEGGKSKRGRFYIPGIPEEATTGSKLTTSHAFWTALVAFAACLASGFIHADPAGGSDLFDMGVYSRKLGSATYPLAAAGFTAINQFTPHVELGTTRSRKIGRGN